MRRRRRRRRRKASYKPYTYATAHPSIHLLAIVVPPPPPPRRTYISHPSPLIKSHVSKGGSASCTERE